MTSEERLLQLEEDNQYLDLKLKYVQSVGTIFRQKLLLMLKRFLHGRENVEHLESAFQGVLDEIDAMEATPSSSPGFVGAQRPAAALSPVVGDDDDSALASDRADYWREQFLALMRESKPSSIQDAQMLCQILQEKNEMAIREGKLRQERDHLENRLQSLGQSFQKVLEDKALTADDALQELYKRREEELDRKFGATKTMKELLARYEHENSLLEQKNKVLRLRLSELRKALQKTQSLPEEAAMESNQRIAELTEMLQNVAATAATKDAEARRLSMDLVLMEKNVALRENSITRLEAQIRSLEQEAACALKEGQANCDTKEIKFLRRKVDSFELHVRKLESECAALREKVAEMANVTEARDATIREHEIEMEVLKSACDTYSAFAKGISIDDAQRKIHETKLQELSDRAANAVDELHNMSNVQELTKRLATMNEQLQGIDASKKAAKAMFAEMKRVKGETEFFRLQLERFAKYEAAPDIDTIELMMVESSIHGNRLARDVVLRSTGTWKEVRDSVSGKVLYITSSPQGTPFDPKNEPDALSEQSPDSSPVAEAAKQVEPQPAEATSQRDEPTEAQPTGAESAAQATEPQHSEAALPSSDEQPASSDVPQAVELPPEERKEEEAASAEPQAASEPQAAEQAAEKGEQPRRQIDEDEI